MRIIIKPNFINELLTLVGKKDYAREQTGN